MFTHCTAVKVQGRTLKMSMTIEKQIELETTRQHVENYLINMLRLAVNIVKIASKREYKVDYTPVNVVSGCRKKDLFYNLMSIGGRSVLYNPKTDCIIAKIDDGNKDFSDAHGQYEVFFAETEDFSGVPAFNFIKIVDFIKM